MRAVGATVVDDLVAVATGVHQGVGENRHAFEGALVIDGASQIEDG
jgi:hypothetical protein